MKRTRNPELKRKQIIGAAFKILREGKFLTKFSLDSVAKEAGVSKGGLIHHFGSKEALLEGLAQEVVNSFEEKVKEGMALEPAGRPGRILRSYVRAGFSREGQRLSDVSPVLLSYTGGREGLGSRFDYWSDIIAHDGVDPVTAAKVRMTTDGVLYTEMIDGQPLERELREQIYHQLLSDIAEGETAT